eukprot:939676-Pleurochrysis_carterae.AAC.1
MLTSLHPHSILEQHALRPEAIKAFRLAEHAAERVAKKQHPELARAREEARLAAELLRLERKRDDKRRGRR